MSKLTTNRLWNAYFGKNKSTIVSHIEAATAVEAAADATKDMNEQLVKLDSEPIYETDIGVELDNDSESENGIFEINIRGTDCKKVDELKKLLAFLINGMPCEFDNDEENVSQSVWAQRLCRFINENSMTVVSV